MRASTAHRNFSAFLHLPLGRSLHGSHVCHVAAVGGQSRLCCAAGEQGCSPVKTRHVGSLFGADHAVRSCRSVCGVTRLIKRGPFDWRCGGRPWLWREKFRWPHDRLRDCFLALCTHGVSLFGHFHLDGEWEPAPPVLQGVPQNLCFMKPGQVICGQVARTKYHAAGGSCE